MGADETALVALSAQVHVHTRDLDGDSSFLVLACAQRHASTGLESADWQVVALQVVAWLLDALGEALRGVGANPPIFGALLAGCAALQARPLGLHGDLHDTLQAGVDAVDVHLHDLVALLAIHFLDASLEQVESLLEGHHTTELEEDALHDHVDALAQAGLDRNLGGVDDEELCFLLGEQGLHRCRQLRLDLFLGPGAIHNTHAARLQVASHVVLLDVALLVDGDVVSRSHIVWGLNGLGAESKMADGDATTLLRIVLEVGLSVQVGVQSDQFHGTLVGTDGTITAETVEHAFGGALGQHVQPLANRQGQVGNVISNADCESGLGSLLHQVLVARDHHVGGELLGAQAIAATDADDLVASHDVEGGRDLAEERLALGARLLGAVQDANTLRGGRECSQESLRAPWAEQTDLQDADLLTLLDQVGGSLTAGHSSTSHDDDHILGLWMTIIPVESEAVAGLLFHQSGLLLEARDERLVVAVASLAGLEEDVGTLGLALHVGVPGVQGGLVVGLDGLPVDHALDGVVVEQFDLVDFVTGSEAIEEVLDRDTALHGHQMRDEGVVLNHLYCLGCEHGPTGGSASHDITVVAEDGKRLGRQGSGGNVHDAGK
mmetsp:Transcript_36539/g.79097  ORF Transcript_36539/g.79097 Transcript_36539/m.79097 type:complete len:607 (-) Transcript_36539:643-2463(-)